MIPNFFPGRVLLTVLILAAALPVEAADAGKLVEAVQPFVDRTELAGAVMLVADKDQVLASKAVGWADVGARRSMRTDSVFWIASQSKPIAAAALMMLVDEGKVSLDDPVGKHLPEFKEIMVRAEQTADQIVLRRPQRAISLRDVLSHCSGLPFKSALEEPTLDLLPLVARVRSYAMTPLDAEPGTKYRYSNAGINTAARVIEVVTGKAFEDFLDERLFRPLGMKDTTFWPDAGQSARLAKSYRPGPKKTGLQSLTINQLRYPLADRNQRFPVPAGGLFSTAKDVSLFYRMLLSGGEFGGRRYLTSEAVTELTRKQTPDAIKTGYGLGLSVRPGSFGHGGAYSTGTTAETGPGLILIWLVQHAGFPGNGKASQGAFRQAALAEFGTK
jgi:CubicO group peptidase (beta-lactamase class C family)